VARCLQELVSDDQRVRIVGRVLDASSPRPPGGTVPDSAPRRIAWRDVCFAYGPDQKDVLRAVSFEWRAGEVLALAGPNGSGKSTCLRAALGLGTLKAGYVLVDGVPIHELDLGRWRRSVAFLPQRPYLPARMSVRECVALLGADVPDEVLRRALDQVGMLKTLVRASPDPMSVKVGGLSAGERQRIALARMLCRPAPLVLLDEPDANLDAGGVRLIGDLVADLARGRMVLVVAHTKELLALADRVVTLEAGAVVSDARQDGRSAWPVAVTGRSA
jgi:ABC-type multidrug transport system fused ATPase/permease subunit